MGLGIEPIPAEPVPSAQDSTLERIRALYEQAKGPRHLDLPLPGRFRDFLKVRYVAVEPDDVTATAKNVRELQQDVLIAACQCILIRPEGSDEYEPLLYGGEPVRFDQAFSELAGLGVPPVEQGGTARAVVLAAFRGAPQPHLAVADHATELERWMAGRSTVNEESLLGES